MEQTPPKRGFWPIAKVVVLVCSALMGLALVVAGGYILWALLHPAVVGYAINPYTRAALPFVIANLLIGISLTGLGIWSIRAAISNLRK